MYLNLSQAAKLLQFLEAEKAKPNGIDKLVEKINIAVETKSLPKNHKMHAKTIRRILDDAKVNGEIADGHGRRYSPEQLMNSARDKLPALYRYAEQQKFKSEIDPSDFFGRVGDFFRTKDDVFGHDDLERLVGVYKMYRRCWFDSPSYNFMQSWVTIYANDLQSRFRFNEKQDFEDYGIKQSNDGYLFPSGTAILAICNATQRDTVKFISISDIVPKVSRHFRPVENFSGNAIATSDQPPHTGYGFQCIRVPIDDVPKKRAEYTCQVFTFDEFKSEKLDIFRKILEYERFQNVDFIPTEGVT